MRTLLLDGDIFAYKAAVSFQSTVEWEAGVHSVWFNEDAGRGWMEGRIAALQEKLEADAIVIALSDTAANFRKSILPTYKSHRTTDKKPVGLGVMKEHLREHFKVYERPRLEGDDVLGILSTSTQIIKGEKIIVSLDKDMKTIPGKLYNDGKPELGVREIDVEEADQWHLMQTLMGDTTDGYTGCPGIGPVQAEKIITDPHRLVQSEKKGKVVWSRGESCDVWQSILDYFAKAKLGPEEALVQARVARILRNTDYNFKSKEPVLWHPPR